MPKGFIRVYEFVFEAIIFADPTQRHGRWAQSRGWDVISTCKIYIQTICLFIDLDGASKMKCHQRR